MKNDSIDDIRNVVEHSFLIKHRFKRLSSKATYQFEWNTLIHNYSAACSIENIAKKVPRNNLDITSKPKYFERINENEDEETDLHGFTSLHDLRSRILAERIQPPEHESSSSSEEDAEIQLNTSDLSESSHSEEEEHPVNPISTYREFSNIASGATSLQRRVARAPSRYQDSE